MPVDPQKGERIAIFLRLNLDSYAFLRDSASILAEHGYQIDWVVGALAHPLIYRGQGVSIIPRPEAFPSFSRKLPRLIRKLGIGGTIYAWLVTNLYDPLARRIFFHPFLKKRHKELPYVCMLGVDPEGLVAAAECAHVLNVPLAFWSLLLLFTDEIHSPAKMRLKQAENKACQEVRFAITQDPARGEALSNENGLPGKKLIYVPNSPRGLARRQKHDYLYRLLKIDPRRKLILCAGMIGQWTLSAELVRAAASWPEEYVLVMQSHTPREKYWEQAYLDEVVRSADPSRVVLSFDPVPSSDYRAMMDSADIGIALYQPQQSIDVTQGRNVRLMGYSSSKLSGYLHCALPVLVNDAVIGPQKMVESWNCGICVSNPEQIGVALTRIFENYDVFSANAIQCFNHELELETHFTPVIEQIESARKSEI
jgi:glycosyltransferase involved in cell wall biosynthesis